MLLRLGSCLVLIALYSFGQAAFGALVENFVSPLPDDIPMTSDAHLDRVETDRGARAIGSSGSAEVGLSEPSEASSGDQPVALRIRLDAGQSSDGNEDALEAGREIDQHYR